MYTWKDTKRQSNLENHGLDFLDAYLVFENPAKVTWQSVRNNEIRRVDIAAVDLVKIDFAVIENVTLLLVYLERGTDVHVISYRRASRNERRFYESEQQDRLGTRDLGK